ncbi:MAG TPA: glycosyltransferase [Ferruginibacter sp.]|nr:glycosyltransferase [Ferruginibacter sp.]HMP19535.1 glycosyltransferase [Ferruginibacter sp.]
MMVTLIIVSLLLFTCYAALIIYYALSWRSIPPFTAATGTTEAWPVITVIIPARNEAANIAACLNSVTQQRYPAHAFEIIVVDDNSTDATAAIARQYGNKNVRVIALPQDAGTQAHKKKAIETAIGQSAGDIIITTDADCTVPPLWLATIAAFYQHTGAACIAMPVQFTSNGSPLQIFQSLDFMTLQGITGASVHQRIHSMCNGANFMYTKKAFETVNGFEGINHIASGDDMLLMHKIYRQYPDKVFFLKSKAVIVQTQPQPTLKAFFNQRIRWASKADKYEDKRIFAVLLLVYLFNVALLLMPIVCLINFNNSSTTYYPLFMAWLFLLLLKTVVELFFLYPVAAFFNNRRLLWWFPLAQSFHILYTVIAGWLGRFGRYQWKGRVVK